MNNEVLSCGVLWWIKEESECHPVTGKDKLPFGVIAHLYYNVEVVGRGM